MPSGALEPQPVLRHSHKNHMHTGKMEQMQNPVSSTFQSQDIAALAGKLENLAQNTPLRFSDEAMRPPTKSNSRFGNYSQNSFFSRHNPHPHRVTHIQGLNGIPICIVNDEWSVSSPLYPHPMIKSQLPTNLLGVPSLPIGDPQGNKVPFLSTGSVSEAWRDELRELAARVAVAEKKPEKKEEEENPRRSTQYSAETGRIIPASARAMSRRASRKNQSKGKNQGTHLQDQELLVLELLCQILQTDSLSAVQQWLLSAGQREKDLVMGMIQTATANISTDQAMGDRLNSQNGLGLLSRDEHVQRTLNSRSQKKQKSEPIPEEDKPERMGTAEVLQIHSPEDKAENNPDPAK